MIDNHDEIEELLAGYAMRSLSGEDAERADRVLTEHVPTCPMCRDTLNDFQAAAADLAFDAPAVEPPDLLIGRLRRDVHAEPMAGSERHGRGRTVALIASAASIVALLVMGGISLSFIDRTSTAEDQRALITQALAEASSAGAAPVSLDGSGEGSMVEISNPNLERLYLMGQCHEPAPGYVYRLWLGQNGQFDYQGDFAPERGYVVLTFTVDVGRYDQLVITEEPANARPTQPSSPWAWSSALT
jgi:anti-sigma-K factor RskA